MRIGVDVDLTVVDTARSWYEYTRKHSWTESATMDYDEYLKFCLSNGDKPNYDFTKLFSDVDFNVCMDFWRSENVYDELLPCPDAVAVLEDLKHSKGYEIVFVSTIKGNHHKSKYYFLDRHFPFMDGFIATKEKQYAKVDLMIDDRLNVLEKMKDTVTVQFQTPFTQTTSFSPCYVVDDWNEFSKLAYRNF